MTKEQVVQFRDVIAKDKILQVVCDNQHIFYDRVAQNARSCGMMIMKYSQFAE